MKYRDLPNVLFLQKLMATSFSSPSQNKKVFDWCNAVAHLIDFVENERVKLVEKYGEKADGGYKVTKENAPSFMRDMNEILDMDVGTLPEFSIDASSFEDDEKCCYPKDKRFWISPIEIQKIMDIKKEQEA